MIRPTLFVVLLQYWTMYHVTDGVGFLMNGVNVEGLSTYTGGHLSACGTPHVQLQMALSKPWRHIRGVVRRTFIMGDVRPHNWVIDQSLKLVAIAVAMCLSPKPCGRFRSFLAGELKWLSRCHIQTLVAIGSRSEILEGFFITLATLLNFSKILFAANVLRPVKGLSARLRQDPSRKGGGVR